MSGLQLAALGFLAFGAITTVATVGEPRKPLTAGTAAGIVFVDLVLAVAVVLLGGAS